MAFCSSCGKEIAEGNKFCSNCGKAIGAVPSGSVVSAALYQPVSAPVVRESAVQPLLVENKKNRLVLIAGIIALAIVLIFLPRAIKSLNESLKNENLTNIAVDVIPLAFLGGLVIITLLAFWGRKNNNKKLIKIASILYFFSFLGIPSAILCIIAFVRMNKNTQVIKQK
jgi:hypothetical protein